MFHFRSERPAPLQERPDIPFRSAPMSDLVDTEPTYEGFTLA
jgi:hypothetical protein